MTAKTKSRNGANRSASNTTDTRNSIASPIDNLLSRLDGVKRTGQDRWQARCPAHGDRHASLSVRETDSGAVLVHCFAGCAVHEVVGAIGLELSDLFPPRPIDPAFVGKPERRPFPAADILRAIGFEALVVACAASAMLAGEPFTQADSDRLMLAVGRIQSALDAGGLNHG